MNGNTPSDDRPPSGARVFSDRGGNFVVWGRKSSIRQRLPFA